MTCKREKDRDVIGTQGFDMKGRETQGAGE